MCIRDSRIIVGYGYDEEEGKRLWMQTRAALRAKYPAAQCEVCLLYTSFWCSSSRSS